MPNSLLNQAKHAVEVAKIKGAQDVWANITQNREVSYDYRDGKIDKVQDATAITLSVRLFVDGKFSSNHTSDLRPKSLENFFAQSIALSKALQPDPHRRITDPKLFAGAPDVNTLKLYDPSIAKMDTEKRQSLCLKIDNTLKGQKDIISASSSVSDTETTTAIASSNNFTSEYKTTTFVFSAGLSLKDGTRKPEDYDYAYAHLFSDLPDPTQIAHNALKNVRAQAGIKKGPTAKTFMLLDARATGSIISRLLSPADAQIIHQKKSFWRDQLGKKKVSDKLTLIDNPLIPGGPGSRPFGRDGIAAKKLTLIDKGVFTNIYADTYGASQLGMTPTTESRSNVIVNPGKNSTIQLAKTAGKGVFVTAWLGGNMDATTGDFSIGVRGHEINNGIIGAPIGEMNITGNILDLFAKLIEVGNEPWRYSSIQSPSLLFEGVQFSGV